MSDRLPKVFDSGQLSLFPTAPRELCKALGLPWWTAIQLHKEGFISFDPDSIPELNEPQMAELSFVGSLVAANCSPEALQDLLSGLTKPYCYSHRKIYYYWPSKTWKPIPELPEEASEYHPTIAWKLIPKFPEHPEAWDLFPELSRQPDEYAAAFQWLDSLGEAGEVETLQDIQNRIDHLLRILPDDGDE
ncbi:MAG: hypothetical protein K9M54_02905 [Kiritimatiellales bacterium]|nr:hypothetical protein [Kiritimatiellales bacterium]MCF7864175.1 hypothetical protein [Kiritimatiellales bacterium]